MAEKPTITDAETPEAPDRPRFSWKFRLLALTMLLGLTLITAELALRILGIQKGGIIVMSDPHTGYTHIPNRTLVHESEGYSVVHINSLGFRDHETTLEKPPGTFRIAILGDSYVEARQVALENAVSEQLESLLNRSDTNTRYEVLNFGMNGYSTAQERQRLEHFVMPFDPDLVILSICTTNDVRDNHPKLTNIARPFFLPDDQGQFTLDTRFRELSGGRRDLRAPDSRFWRIATWTTSNVRLAGIAIEAVRTFTQRKRHTAPIPELADIYTGSERDLNIYNPNPPEVWQHAWLITQFILDDMNTRCRLRDIPFVAVIQGSSQQVDPAARETFTRLRPELDVDHPEKRLIAFFTAKDITHLPLSQPFLEHYKKTGQHLHGFGNRPGIGHWNEKGHERAAQIIHQFLVDQNLLDD